MTPAKARELLAEAGWKDTDGDGIIDKDGVPFSFTIVTNQGNDLRAKTAELIQNKLKNVGIKVNIRIVEWAAFLSEFIETKDFEAVILGWNILQDPDLYDVWHSSKIGPNELNHISFANAEVDRLLVEGRRTFDLDGAKEGLRSYSGDTGRRSALRLPLYSLCAAGHPVALQGHRARAGRHQLQLQQVVRARGTCSDYTNLQ